ncbi:Maf family protein [soil metagenome]
MRLVLASASPARLATLRAAGLDPEVIVSGVDESVVDSTVPSHLAAALAQMKARAVADTLGPDALVIGCDSVLAFKGDIYGKPGTSVVARDRWKRMRGNGGVLHTGHCVIYQGHEIIERAETTVHFAQITDSEIEDYLATGEPLRVAGGFTIDGLGAPFVEGIVGDHHNVVGISLPLLRTMLADVDVAWTSLWAQNPPT